MFDNLVELIAKCGGNKVYHHLPTAPKNEKYMSPLLIAKDISIINHYFEEPLLTSLHMYKHALYNDETQEITFIKQMANYASLTHNGKIFEYYVGILPLSKHIGSHLSVTNILHVLQKYLENQEIPVSNA